MRFIFHYPETTGYDGDGLDAGPLREVAIAVERAGFDGLSLSEHPMPGARWLASGGHQTLDPLVALGYVAGATERTGYQKSEFHAFGVDFEERNALFDETLEVLPLHWRGEPFSYQAGTSAPGT